MEEASFQFRNYYINKSIVEMSSIDVPPSKFGINIIPSGVLSSDRTELELVLIITIKNERVNIEVETIGFFDITNPDDDFIENFLYINAPAIIFPYIRAYISTLTTLSGRKAVILPTLNMTDIGEELKGKVSIKSTENEE